MKTTAPPIAGFEAFPFDKVKIAHWVYRKGEGPAVILMHELPGMTAECISLAKRLAAAGYTIYMPLLFGKPNDCKPRRFFARLCISREFKLFANGGGSPISEWLRLLSRRAHEECGGSGVGAIGMCLTGNFALGLAVDEQLMAPVLSQPSLPLGRGAASQAALALTDRELSTVKTRTQAGLPVLGLRFSGDSTCPPQRFDTLRRELGDAFEGIEIDSSPGNPHGISPRAHSVLTRHLIDREGHPTRAALDRVLEFLEQQLKTAG